MEDVVEELVEEAKETQDMEAFRLNTLRYLSIDYNPDPDLFEKSNVPEISAAIMKQVQETYARKGAHMCDRVYPVIKEVYEVNGNRFENIIIPVTDGKKTYQVLTHLKRAYESKGRELLKSFEKTAILANIDDQWKEHLRELDDLKQSVQNASYEQKDPLLIYKFESFNLFKTMVEKVNKDVVSLLTKGQIPIREPEEVRSGNEKRLDMSRMQTQRSDHAAPRSSAPGGDTREPQRPMPVKVEKHVGRNDPCPCGSGKKYKNCHGKDAE
jgi:preprotein translocase subunit SecA